MIYPESFEIKIGFDTIRTQLKELCLSPIGEENLKQLGFSNDISYVLSRLNEVNEFKNICLFEDNFPVSYYFDVRAILHKFRVIGTFIEIHQLYDLKRSLESIRSILSFFKDKKEKYPTLTSMIGEVQVYPFVLEKINSIITSNGRIKDNASVELHSIRKNIVQKQSSITKTANKVLRQAQSAGIIDMETAVSIRNGRHVIPVNSTHKRRINGIIMDESASGKTTFIEPTEIVNLNNELRELEYAERREIVNILTLFCDEIRPYIDDLLKSYEFMGKIDFIRAKALFAVKTDSSKPDIQKSTEMNWMDTLHPLLYLHHKNLNKTVIPLDIYLNPENRILVISGPNAGGKSVCLKTVGLVQYMLQSGMLVPMRENSTTCLFDDIFIDIGDEQSIDNDLSTYSSHLLNMKHFLKNSNNKSLILIDEFGTGTEPNIGGAIAESILEKLNEIKTYGVVTTHYSNLKHVAMSLPGINNGAMLYDTQAMKPLYQLIIGKPGSSFAFEIARKIGLPEEILEKASEKVGKDQISFDKNLREVLRDKRYWETKRQKIKRSEKKLEDIIDRYETELNDIKNTRKEIISQAKAEAKEIISGINKKIENTVRTIKEHNAEKERTRENRQEVQDFTKKATQNLDAESQKLSNKLNQINKLKKKSETKPSVKKPENPAQTIEVGVKVKVKGQNMLGEVMEINNNSILISFGNMITTVAKNKLEVVSENEFKSSTKVEKKSNTVLSDINTRKLNFKQEIDIRGKRAEEALHLVAEFVDEAIMVNATELRILHGKGNGVLRQIIREYLQSVDVVDKVKDEHIERGGSGITLVSLIL